MNLLSSWRSRTTFLPSSTATSYDRHTPLNSNILQTIAAILRHRYPRTFGGHFSVGEMLQIAALCSLIPGFWYLRKRKDGKSYSLSSSDGANGQSMETDGSNNDVDISDPGLLKKHSEIKSYTTSRFTYPNIRIFYRRHPQADKLPTEPAPLPLLVFIHGLGGSVAQFHPLLTSLVNLASCLSIDLPGCGMSSMEPKEWLAYETESLVGLLDQIINEYRKKEPGQGVVLIGHSMGASLAAQLASTTSLHRSAISDHVVGLIAVCPKADPPNEKDTALFKKLLMIPGSIFNAWRGWDRRGGTESKSVHRFVGASADLETKKLQFRFNEQSKTPTWRRMARGSLPVYENGIAKGGLPGKEIWSGLQIPVFLVAGEADHVTKPGEVEKISAFLGKSHPVQIEMDERSQPISDAAAPVDLSLEKETTDRDVESDGDFVRVETVQTDRMGEDPSTPTEEISQKPLQPLRPRRVLKTTILPAPASHALLYQSSTVRILAGLISDFLSSQVSPRLSLGWQLQFLSTSGKWDVKNLAKWQAVNEVSEPIAGVFRAMKTLREVDEKHCPEVFVRNWGDQVKDIVDISHESPVYDPRGLEKGGVRYHKFPTVSKIPPTAEEVSAFISLVDRLRVEQKARSVQEKWDKKHYIGVHCHYGFNRTGYFVVCYMIERLGFDVQQAVDEFARQRPKGIKHAHFLDQLFVRYCKGLKRAPTL